MKYKKEEKKKKAIALTEVFLMVMTTIAIAFIMQQSFGLVSAQERYSQIKVGDTLGGQRVDNIIETDGQLNFYAKGATSPFAVSDSDGAIEGTWIRGTSSNSGGGSIGDISKKSATPTGTAFTAVKNGKAIGYNVGLAPGSTATKFTVSSDKLISGPATIDNVKQIAPGDTAGTTKITGANGETTVVNQPIEEVKASVTKSGATVSEPLSGAALGKGLFEGVVWAAAVYGLTYMLAGAFGASDNMKTTLSASLAVGVLVWKGTSTLAQGKSQFWSGGGSIIAGLAAAAIVFFLMYKEEKQRIVNFECDVFEPPLGGKQCEECNKYPFKPCSEYRCKSLGQACELLNAGTSNESCAWVSKFDTTSPTISTWKEPLYPLNLRYNPDTSRPSGLGSKIVRTNGTSACLEAFTPLTFGITTNEPSQCKIDYGHTNSYKNMTFMFGQSSLFVYNHSQSLRLPAPESSNNLSESPLLKNDGSYTLYVRCIDANGNENVDEYTFKFCVDKSPDTTPPIVESTSIISGSPVQYNISNVPIQVYTNEPATCKWSRISKDYNDMEYNMSCSNSIVKVNSDLVYPCTGNLTGIKDRENNAFYFRCKDNPTKAEKDRNVMSQSYQLILKGSQPLNILKAGPNETIYGSTDVSTINLTIETDDGAEDGKAWCYYSTTGNNGDYIMMYQTNNSVRHLQQLDLTNGAYTYYYRCIDNAGNRAETNVSFSVFVDKNMPLVTRVYKDNPEALKVVTDEDAECAYSLSSCNFNFDEGQKMIYNPVDVQNVLLAQWKDNGMYYIKCRDGYGNQPSPNQCSIVVNAAKLIAVN